MLANLRTAKRRNQTLAIVALAALVSLAALPLMLPLMRGLRTPVSTSNVALASSQGVDFRKLPLSFEPNEGQTDPSVKYMAHASGGTMYFTPAEVVLAFQSAPSVPELLPSDASGSVGLASLSISDKASCAIDAQPTSSVVRLQFIGANPDTEMSSGEALPGKVNYFIGNDPSKWHADVPTYSSTHYGNLYPGIDLKYEGTGGQLKGTFTVAPGADPSLIQWSYAGAQSVHVDQAGNMQVMLSGDDAITVTEQAPVAWQEIGGKHVDVKVIYNLSPNNQVSFVPVDYDRNYSLIIDPTLTYSTYLGGSSADYAESIAVDASGNAYVTGWTLSANFPLQNPFQPTHAGGTIDAFVTKFSATGSTVVYSTYLGGGGDDRGYGIEADASGNAYITGFTYSTNFPLQDPFQPTHGGGAGYSDAFVTKFSPTGSTLIYSTYLGGSQTDNGYGIEVDGAGYAFVTGYTGSTNFPLQNPFQSARGGGVDVFVTKFNTTGSSLLYSTFLGGSSDDFGRGIVADASGNAYVTGYTGSTNFPLQNPFQSTRGGGNDDAFVTEFSPTGSILIYSTYLGGSYGDRGYGISADASGNAYITGFTYSDNFPLQDPFQPARGGTIDAFVTKFSPTGSTLIYSTFLGGITEDYGYGIEVDGARNAYVTGPTSSDNFPLQDPFQPIKAGTFDAFVTKFSPTGSTLIYSTFLGGSDFEHGSDIALDTSGNAYVTGYTYSGNFPLQNPFQPTYGGGQDAFVAKISDQQGSPTPSPIPMSPTSTSTSISTMQATATSTGTPASTLTTTPLPTATCQSGWNIVSSPNLGPDGNILFGVEVVSPKDVWSVGRYSTGKSASTLVEHWDGSAWNVVPSPNVGSGENSLIEIVAVSANDIWAVGYSNDASLYQTLIEHWDGNSWSIVPSPNTPGDNRLFGAAVVSPNDIWAVGYSGSDNSRTLIEHWNGTEWNVVASPNPSQVHNSLRDIVAVSANDVWAVGTYIVDSVARTLVVHWDGNAWSVVPSPNAPGNNILYAVAAAGPNDIWLVGSFYNGGTEQTLIEHWDGTAWSVVPSPNFGSDNNILTNVSAAGANDVWAVGYHYSGSVYRTLTEHWDGTEWSIVPSPNPQSNFNILYGVAMAGANDVWAVGNYGVGNHTETLIEHYTDMCATPTISPTSSLPSATQTNTPIPTFTTTATTTMFSTSTASMTNTTMPTVTVEPSTPTSTPCPLEFTDVPPTNTFYENVRCLACRGIISGYSDSTFRPNNEVTRGQLAKIVSNAAGFAESPDPQIFEDVPSSNTFYQWINRLARRGHMGGYSCGGLGEPCNSGMPYFRPSANATRGQTSKIVSNAAGFVEEPTDQTFEDVPPTHTFYREIQRLATRNIMGGYACGGIGEPCLTGKPYFRPTNNVTRGQSAKIVANAFYPECQNLQTP